MANDYKLNVNSGQTILEDPIRFLNLPTAKNNRRLNPMNDGSKSENVRYRKTQKDIAKEMLTY